MTVKPDDTSGTDGANAWSKVWFDALGRMAAAGFSFPAESAPPAATRQMRDAFLRAMSVSCEEHMRSPEFLEMMKASMDRAITFRTQMNEWLRRAYGEANLPAREDIEVLAGRMQSIERELFARMDALEQKLTAILERLPAPQPVQPSAPHTVSQSKGDWESEAASVRRKPRKR